MKKIIVTRKQLNEYIETKKAENVFTSILESLHKNMKHLNENISLKNANQSVINDYKLKNLITPKIHEMLVKHKIVNEKYEII